MFLDEFLDYGEDSPKENKKIPQDLKVFRICEHCNFEYQIKFYIFADESQYSSTIQTCPHCEKTDHPWITVKRK